MSFIFRNTRNTKTEKMIYLAVFIAIAAVIQTFENIIFPISLPLRPGIANIITLVVIGLMGKKEAFSVTIGRSILAGLISGKLLSPSFFLSLSGGIVSTLIMSYFYKSNEQLTEVGVSILGAISHVMTQILVIYCLFIHNTAIFGLFPWLGLTALITGFINGIAAKYLIHYSVIKKILSIKKESINFESK